MKRKARELKHEEEEKAKSIKHAEKVKKILADLTAKEKIEQTTEQENLKLQQHLQESAGGRGHEELQHLQQVAADALAKQFQFPIVMAERAVKVVEKALVEAAQSQGECRKEPCEIDPADI